MLSISYDAIYSRFLSKVEAYDLISEYTEEVANELMDEWLVSTKANPRVRKLFSSVQFDADERTINFEIKYAIDDDSDRDFIIEVFGSGIAWKWANKHYVSIKNVCQFFGTKETQYFSQSNHMSQLEIMSKNEKNNFYNIIRDRSTYNNSYLEAK